MSGVTADAADDVGSKVALLGAIILAMADIAAVLTNLVFVVTESTVQCRKLAELVPLVIVLTFGSRGRLQVK
jgi:hypothetical protein